MDLRSDTVTRPTPAMRQAMADAEVGDDVYGEDPTVNALEQRVADLLGHEAGLFTPTGSMANQLGLRMLVAPGQELVCDVNAHVVRAELGAAAALSGITTRTFSPCRGILDDATVDDVVSMLRPDAGPHLVSTAAVAVENTHNFGGGTVQPLASLHRLREATADLGIAMHLDGARLWNAHIASGVAFSTYGECFDTVSVCLSKGLGAPIGSVLVGSVERVAAARIWRKRLGAGMRQVGVLAAAGHYALDHHLDRLADDHRRARAVAEAVHGAVPDAVDLDTVMTNIVMLTVEDASTTAAKARADGVHLGVLDRTHLRVLTHLDVDDADIDRAISVLLPLLRL